MGEIANQFGDLENPPLVYTLFMLRYPEQLNLDDQVPAIQSVLKKLYPIYQHRDQQSISLTQRDDGQSISTSTVREHLFFNEDKTRGFLLKKDRLLFHTCSYKNFDAFKDWVTQIVTKVLPILELSHYSAAGIRFIDAIEPQEGEEFSDILKEELLQLPLSSTNLSLRGAQSTHLYQTQFGSLILKAYCLMGNAICVPPDIQDVALLLNFENPRRDRPFVVLDFDHNYAIPNDGVAPLDIESLMNEIEAMHDSTSLAFLDAIKTDTMDRWKKNG